MGIGKLLRSFRDLLFPPLCLHCRENIEEESAYLCFHCIKNMELIDPIERCPHCFSMEYCVESKRCSTCRPKEMRIKHMAAAFDYIGPPASIIRQLKYGNQPYLAKGAAAWMVAQFLRLEWSLPDLIIPVPISSAHRFERGYNQSEHIAEEVSLLLERPLCQALKRLSGDYSQAGLNHTQRKMLSSKTLQLTKPHELYDKSILLIDDVMTTGSTLHRCAEILHAGYPTDIYGITFCRAVKQV